MNRPTLRAAARPAGMLAAAAAGALVVGLIFGVPLSTGAQQSINDSGTSTSSNSNNTTPASRIGSESGSAENLDRDSDRRSTRAERLPKD